MTTRYHLTEDECQRAIDARYGDSAWEVGVMSWATQGPQPIIAGTYIPSPRTCRDGRRRWTVIPYGTDQTEYYRRRLAERDAERTTAAR